MSQIIINPVPEIVEADCLADLFRKYKNRIGDSSMDDDGVSYASSEGQSVRTQIFYTKNPEGRLHYHYIVVERPLNDSKSAAVRAISLDVRNVMPLVGYKDEAEWFHLIDKIGAVNEMLLKLGKIHPDKHIIDIVIENHPSS